MRRPFEVVQNLAPLAVFASAAAMAFIHYNKVEEIRTELLVGIVIVGLVVFFVFAASQPTNAPDDPGFGLGAMLVTVAIAPPLALFLSFGGGVGRLIRSLRNQGQLPVSPSTCR